MNERLLDAFENCLKDMEKGASIEESLIKYPQLSDELRPPLEAAVAARSIACAEVPSMAINRSRTHILGHAARMRSEKPPKISFLRFPTIVFTALLIALVFILGTRELGVVSAESLPGDSLYPIKRAVQDIRVRFAPNQEAQHEIESQYRTQHIDEVLVLIDRRWERIVSFEGIVEQMAPAKWIVGNVPVILTDETVVIGDIRLGSLVEVEGLTTTEGVVEAHELHLREFNFIGQVKSIEKDLWIISGEEFEITSITQIDSSIQLDDTVLVLARSRDNGIHIALAILRLPTNINNTVSPVNENSTLISGKKAGEQFEFSGSVYSISATAWIIDGYSVIINLLTEVSDEINPGDYVKVHVILGEGGTLTALEIEIASDAVDDDRDDDSDDSENDDFDDDPQDDDGDEDESDDDGLMDDDLDDINDDDDSDSDDDDSDSDDGDDDGSDGSDSGSDDDSEDDGGEDPEESEETEEPEESDD